MNKIILRFNVIKSGQVFEVIFDKRLSFIDNFKLLKELNSFELEKDMYIYDLDRVQVLRKDVPLSEFNIQSNITLYLF